MSNDAYPSSIQAGYLVGVKAAVVLVLVIVILPMANHVLSKTMRPTQKDLTLARASCLSLLFGSLAIGISKTDTAMVLGKKTP